MSSPGRTRVVRTYRQTIDARPDGIFPLLCPERERAWLDGWHYRMVYSASGVAEEGAVFETGAPTGGTTVWIVTRRDQGAGIVQFATFVAGSTTCLLTIVVSAHGESRSHVDVTYAHTALGPEGEAALEAWTEARFRADLEFWERSMNHYLRTGARLGRDDHRSRPGG